MYLFDTLHQATNALNASQLGLQVAGQNLSNVETPGYVRENLILETGTSRKLGNGTIVGTGVQVAGVVQVLDKFLEERLRHSTSDALSTSTQEKYYTQLEALLNETTDSDLSSSLSSFFNAIDNVNNQPENVQYRTAVVESGVNLTDAINRLDKAVADMQVDVNKAINDAAAEINRLLSKIDELNKNITLLETKTGKQAVGLRDERLSALSDLSSYLDIKTAEDEKTKGVTVYSGSNILLTDGYKAEIKVSVAAGKTVNNVVQAQLVLQDENTPLDVRGGIVAGLYSAHQDILGGYRQKLQTFTNELINSFNQIYTSGQGLTGYTEVISSDRETVFPALTAGSFTLQLHNKNTGTTTETDIVFNPAYTTLADIAEQLDGIDGITSMVNSLGQLVIRSDAPNDYDFGFSDDTSGVLAALGLNTFFTSSGDGIGINQAVRGNPALFAASAGGIGNDVDTGIKLAAMGVTANSNLGGYSVSARYGGIVSETMSAAATVKAAAAADTLYQQSLQTQRDSISGVDINEETILMMTYQRMFQANSRIVTIINEMMNTLLAM